MKTKVEAKKNCNNFSDQKLFFYYKMLLKSYFNFKINLIQNFHLLSSTGIVCILFEKNYDKFFTGYYTRKVKLVEGYTCGYFLSTVQGLNDILVSTHFWMKYGSIWLYA